MDSSPNSFFILNVFINETARSFILRFLAQKSEKPKLVNGVSVRSVKQTFTCQPASTFYRSLDVHL